MNKQDFIKLLQKPYDLTAADLKKLEELAGNFPFCQAAHILIAKANYDYGSMLTEQKIKKASLYTADRKNLKEFINRKEPNPNNKTEENSPPDTSDSHPNNESSAPSLPEKGIVQVPENKVITEPKAESSENSDIKSRKDFLLDRFLQNFSEEAIQKSTEANEGKNNIHLQIQENLKILKNYRIQKDSEAENNFLADSQSQSLQSAENYSYTKPETEDIPEPETITAEIMPAVTETFPEFKTFHPVDDFVFEEPVIAPEPARENPAKEISESELLLGYLDFLKSNRSQLKKDPVKINSIIDRFIMEEPAISPLRKEKLKEEQEDLAAPVFKQKKGPVSETFAILLEKQGKFEKSIEIYEALILKYPEKKTYFASRIEELNKQLNK